MKQIFTTLCVTTAAFCSLLSCQTTAVESSRELILSGHRGTPVIAPENTMASIDSAIKYGVHVSEVDVCISSDSVFYILHDYTLDRTTNGTGKITEQPSSYIDTLDAGSWFGEEFAGLRVPRFRDVLKRAKEGGLEITIDYRNGGIQELYDLIKEEGMLEHCYFTMREEPYFELRSIDPNLKTMQAYISGETNMDAEIEKWKPNIAVVWMDSLTKDMVDRIHAKDIQVLALSLKGENPDTVGHKKAVEIGVDVLATDRADYYAKQYAAQRANK
ncbi:MAG: glycerophosphodiester phosphodiesterase family protein [Rikenellaceae bacterium]